MVKRHGLFVVLSTILIFFILFEIFLRVGFGDRYAPRLPFWVLDEELGWRVNSQLDSDFHGKDYRIHVRTDENGYPYIGKLSPDNDGLTEINP